MNSNRLTSRSCEVTVLIQRIQMDGKTFRAMVIRSSVKGWMYPRSDRCFKINMMLVILVVARRCDSVVDHLIRRFLIMIR